MPIRNARTTRKGPTGAVTVLPTFQLGGKNDCFSRRQNKTKIIIITHERKNTRGELVGDGKKASSDRPLSNCSPGTISPV